VTPRAPLAAAPAGRERRPLLLTPGPVELSPGVKAALCECEISHRGPAFSTLLRGLASSCRELLGAPRHRIAFLSGSSTCGMEAGLTSTVPRGGRVLVLVNGTFGSRLGEILDCHGIGYATLDFGFAGSIALPRVARALATGGPWHTLAMAHHETSSGILNPIAAVGRLARRHGVRFYVDATSSAGVEDLDLTRDGIDVCVTSSGKCLHSAPGVSIVCAAAHLLEGGTSAASTFYLDLRRYVDYLERSGQTPFTPSVPLFTALECAVRELTAETVAGRRRRYLKRRRAIVAGAGLLGLRPLPLPRGAAAASLVTLELPRGVDFSSLAGQLLERGYVVYGCKPPLQDRYFQVAVMGEFADERVPAFIEALGAVVRGGTPRRRSAGR
jgi:2-aminoethylphosphonate-pyruvate transaminase